MAPPFRWVMLTAALAAAVLITSPASAGTAETPAPFGFGIGTFSYEETLTLLRAKDWSYIEYEKIMNPSAPGQTARDA